MCKSLRCRECGEYSASATLTGEDGVPIEYVVSCTSCSREESLDLGSGDHIIELLLLFEHLERNSGSATKETIDNKVYFKV